MALKLLAIGCVKSGNKVYGYRLIDYNEAIQQNTQSSRVKYLDLPSASIINALRNKQVTVDNLEITNNELKGSNGQSSRYGIVDAKTLKARSQVMVIVSEVKDINGYLVGYICSDTNGNIVRLLTEQAIAQAGRMGLANGKLVDNGSGLKHIATISGSYSTVRLNYDYKSKAALTEKVEQQQKQKSQTTESGQQDKAEQVQLKEKEINKEDLTPDGLYKKALETITELEKYKAFKTDFSYKIAASVKRWHKCSEKQFNVLDKALKSFQSNNAEKVEQTKSNELNKVTEQPKKEGSQHSEVQRTDIKRKNSNTYSSGIKQVELDDDAEQPNENISTQINLGNEPAEPTSSVNKTEPDDNNADNDPDESTEQIELSNILKNQRLPVRKENTHVSDLGIFDFGIINNEIYIRGLKEGVELPDDIVMPDTVKFQGSERPVIGIAIEAFKNSKIKTVRTGKYIRDIGAGAFSNCSALEYIDLSQSKHSMIPAKLAYGCKKLVYVHLGNNIERIHELAFFECSSLVVVDANSSIDTIARQSFAFCRKLIKFNTTAKFVNEGAFEGCMLLTEDGFNLSNTVSIATKGFKGTGFKVLTLPGNTKTVGRKAFADCALLRTVNIDDGVELVDMYCFAKSEESCRNAIHNYRVLGVDKSKTYCDIEVIDTPKSLKDVGNDAFRHVKLVKVFTGSASESVCIGFNVPYERKDDINKGNSTRMRQRSGILNIDPIKLLNDNLQRVSEGSSNPDFSFDTSKLLNAKLTESHFKTLGFNTPISEQKEPHIKFKAALKYVLDLAEPFTLPLTPSILRFSDIIKIETKELFGDGWNEIYKTTFFKRDTLESGSFITFMQGDNLVYIVEASSALDMELTSDAYNDLKIPIKDHLHAGDKIGNDSTIDGKDASRFRYEDENGVSRRVNVGLNFFNRIKENSIIIKATRTTYIYYVPSSELALVLFDSRKDKAESAYRMNNDYVYFTVTKMLTYKQLLDFIQNDKNLKIEKSDSYTFMFNLSKVTQADANRMIRSVKYVSEESCDTLFEAGLQCEEMLKSRGLEPTDMTPDMLTYDMFNILTGSYWMVEKDLDWYHSISAKTLNKINEYTIGSFIVVEYRSNQVVKFSNPYMHGRKNSIIFVLKRGNNIYGIYASVYTLDEIAKMLAKLTYMTDELRKNAPVLMKDAYNLDEVNPEYFYHFYSVLQTNGGWDLQKSYGGFADTILYCMRSEYYLSMYKPTGIFYLTMETYVLRETKDFKTGKKKEVQVSKVIYPIFPIGDMDRALMVADTTNTNNRYARFKEELVQLAIYEKIKQANRIYRQSREFPDIDPTNYYKIRHMSMSGVQETFEYSKYVDDRAAFMIGRVHDESNQVNSVNDTDFEDTDYTDSIDGSDEYEEEYTDEFDDDEFADIDDDDEYFQGSEYDDEDEDY